MPVTSRKFRIFSQDSFDEENRLPWIVIFDNTHSTTSSPLKREHTEPTKFVSAKLPSNSTSSQTRAGVEIFAMGTGTSKKDKNTSGYDTKKQTERTGENLNLRRYRDAKSKNET